MSASHEPAVAAPPLAAAPSHPSKGRFLGLSVAALGVVYGDIGTSPLYAIDQIFFGHGDELPDPARVVGGLSLVIWTLTLIVAVKYAILVLRAQNDGEGGVFALYGLLHTFKNGGTRVLLWLLMLGAGLLFGDGMITPAVSVLSAVEGLTVAAPALAQTVVPATLLLLTALFAIQRKGTTGVGAVFGPILILWFGVIAVLGVRQIVHDPAILAAVDPLNGIGFLLRLNLRDAFVLLGALMLVVTGGEAMYADMGHFGALPIRLTWFSFVYPCLILNYLGQGAYLLSGEPVAAGKVFYSLVPAGLLLPMVLLATLATVIASQSLISGAFSLVSQAIGLGLFPRLPIRHTHHAHAGQIYVPFINWALYVGCVLLVVAFGSSAALAAAYGLAVAGVMVITSLAMFPIARLYWNWSTPIAVCVWGALAALNGTFFLACLLKFLEGGFVPLTVGVVVFLVMATWRWGRKATFAAYSAKTGMTMGELVRLHRESEVYLERNALIMASKPLRRDSDRTPALFRLLWERTGILPRNLIFVEVSHPKVPYVRDGRYLVTVFERDPFRGSVISVEVTFGFMEEPNVERVLEEIARHHEIDLPTDPRKWVVHVSHENLVPSRTMGFAKRLRFWLFMFLRLVSRPTYYYYGLGDEVQLVAEIMPVRVH
jgi:KUP system potassium uptake protein